MKLGKKKKNVFVKGMAKFVIEVEFRFVDDVGEVG